MFSPRFPQAKWVSWEPAARDNTRAGAVLAFGEPVEAQYRFDQADVILSLEADFVASHPESLRLVREFASRRKVSGETPEMNRLYVVEGSPTSTGATADHRLPLRSSEIEGFARAVAAGLGVPAEGGVGHAWVAPIAKDLKRAGARALVIAGESQPPAVHALAHAMNEALGAVGTTVTYTAPAEAAPVGETAALQALVGEMQAGTVEVLVVLGSNPAYAAPADLEMAAGARQGPAPDPPRALRRRDRGALPLAPAGVARARELGGPACRGRDGVDRPAPHRAAVRHALRDRGPGRLRRGRAEGLRRRPRALGGPARRGRVREALEPRPPRRGRGRHRVRGRDR